MTSLPSPVGQHRTEKQVERECDEIMALLGFTAIRFSQPRNTMQTRGIPDRKYYHPDTGATLWFECKRPSGTQSQHQRAFQEMAEACGELYVLGGREALGAAMRPLGLDRLSRYNSLLAQLFPEHFPLSRASAQETR